MRQGVVLRFVGEIPEHVLHIAGEDAAQVVQGGGGDVPVLLQGVQRPPAEGIVLDERVGGEPPAFQGLPQRVIHDHQNHLPSGFIIFPTGGIEYSRYIGYNPK